MQSFNKQAFEEDMNSIAKYLKRIFESLKCRVEGHKSAPTTFCHHEFCERRLLCPECLLNNQRHVIEHHDSIVTIGQFIEQVLVHNMDSFSIGQAKTQELADFYQTVWRGLQLCFRESFTLQSEKIKLLVKEIFELISEMAVRVKTELLEQYDAELNRLKKVMDEAMLAVKASSEFNINEVVENLLLYLKKNNDSELSFHMYKLWTKKTEISMNLDSFKVFQRYLDTKSSLNFDTLVPMVTINESAITEKIVQHVNQVFTNDIKFRQGLDSSSMFSEKTIKILKELDDKKDKDTIVDLSKRDDKLSSNAPKKSLTEEGMILMSLAMPKSIVGNKRTSRSMTRKSTSVTGYGAGSISSKEKKDGDSARRSSNEASEALQGIFNIPFMIPAPVVEKKKTIGTNEIKVTLKLGGRIEKETQLPIESFLAFLTEEQAELIEFGTKRQIEMTRVNDEIGLRQTIIKAFFPEIEFKKRYVVYLTVADITN